MHVLVLGATGRTGVYAYKYALEQGHHVTVIIRDASAVQAQDNLTIVQGSVLSEEDMAKAFAAANLPVDAVVICLNPKRVSDNPWAKFVGPPRLMANATAIAARLLRKQVTESRTASSSSSSSSKPRLVVMNALGSGASKAVTPWVFRLVMDYSNIGKSYEDHDAVDAEIEEVSGDDLSWTLVLAVGLGAAGQKPVKTLEATESGAGWHITRESCARWMVDVAIGKEGDKFSDKKVIVSN